MIFDTHAHYDDEQFDTDRDELLNTMAENGVGTIVNVSAAYESCERVVRMAQRYPFMYAAVGVHPDEVGSLDDEKFDGMKELFKNDKVVAVGEIGLDYYWDNESHKLQKEWFIRQLELARELNLPINVHSREAAQDTMQVIKEYGKGLDGVIHCYSYSKEMAQEYVKMGFFIGIGGVVTFKNARRLKETAETVPLSAIVLETDCPYLAPEPYRGKRNDSSLIKYTAEKIAEMKGITYEEVVRRTEENARKLYRL
ncbi:MAG: TatD family hydrolase [Dorea sp.]|nr:TatD family hydrolase [Dorea sp.]